MKRNCWFLVLMLSILVSCGESQQAMQTKSVMTVKVNEVTPISVSVVKKYPADIIGKVFVDIKPQVTGYVEELVIKEGSKVKKGDVIVKISEDKYIQVVRSAKASVGVAEASVENAILDVERTQSLYDNKIVSKFDLKNAENTLLLKKAQLSQAVAQLQNAEVNLGFTNITSPTDGVIGTINCFEGTLVSPADQTPITTVSDTDVMYAYFVMSEVELLNMSKDREVKNVKDIFDNPKLILANGSQYELDGTLDAVSGVVDRNSGTVSLRAIFKNNGDLRGGSNGYILLPIQMDNVVLVPQSATKAMQDKLAVYVVGNDSKVETRFITVMNETHDDSFVVLSGLESGDKVIVENTIKMKPGSKVAIKK